KGQRMIIWEVDANRLRTVAVTLQLKDCNFRVEKDARLFMWISFLTY
ncbi:hypothetical protein EVA_21403, partial [gut metagenome]